MFGSLVGAAVVSAKDAPETVRSGFMRKQDGGPGDACRKATRWLASSR